MATNKVTPDFFVIGNSKSGTTALYRFLLQHPEICMSDPKEPNYFASDFCHSHDVGAFRQMSEAEYLSIFPDSASCKVRGEASACYLYSQVAAEGIARFNPRAKCIAMLREPVSFLQSYHMQMLKNPASEGEVVKDFAAALSLERDRKEGRKIPRGCLVPELLFYRDRVRYADQLRRFFAVFPREQIRVYIYEDFRNDNASIVRDVFDFLGVDADFEPAFGQYNKGEKLRSKTLQKALFNLTHGRGAFALLKPLLKAIVPGSARARLTRATYRNVVFKSKDDIDSSIRLELMRDFAPCVRETGKLLGMDLVSRWRYDAIDSSPV